MIVPQFKLKQNDTHVIVYIRVPYIKVNACEFYIESYSFKFYLKPYLLSLSFEQSLRQGQQPSRAIYYHEKYLLEVYLEKSKPGEFFTDLELIASLLNNKKSKKKKKVAVEVVTSSDPVLVDQQPSTSPFNYGFAMNYDNLLDNLDEENAELFQFDPKTTPLTARLDLNRQIVIKQFDFDSYFYDKYENISQIEGILLDQTYLCFLEKKLQQFEENKLNPAEFKLKMSGKELLVAPQSEKNIFKQIVSIIFSYLYELVCMAGEMGTQSAKTINKTSLILSCNHHCQGLTLKETIIQCVRRCLTYSLYKSTLICVAVLKCLAKMLDSRFLVVVLMDIREMFERSEPRYLLNKLYIDDYLIYLFALKNTPEEIQGIRLALSEMKVTEDDLELGIKAYEQAEQEEQRQEIKKSDVEENGKKLVEEFDKLNTLD